MWKFEISTRVKQFPKFWTNICGQISRGLVPSFFGCQAYRCLNWVPYVSNSTPDPNHQPWVILSFTLQYILNNSVGLVQCTCLYMVKTEILSNSDDEHDACAPVLCMLSMLGCAVVAAEVAFCCSVLLLLFSTLLLLLVSNSRLHQRLLWDRGGEEARGIQNTNYYHIAHREQDYMQLFIGSKKEIFKNCTHKYVP